jgi:hypothetical protein
VLEGGLGVAAHGQNLRGVEVENGRLRLIQAGMPREEGIDRSGRLGELL